jgi:hypothetical protein
VSPVGKRERVTELLDTLEMSDVAGGQLEAVSKGDGRNQRVGRADGPSYTLQLTSNAACQLTVSLVEGKHFLGGERG